MLNKSAYARAWEEKQAWYKYHGITKDSEGERLVITKDSPDGKLDAYEIQHTIEIMLK